MPTRPAQSPGASEPPSEPGKARCSRCLCFLASDNSEDYCSPCGSYYAELQFRAEYAGSGLEKSEARERRRMARALTIADVPLPSHDDAEEPEVVRMVVLAFGRGGSYDAAHRQLGMGEGRVQNILRRIAARELIDAMVEEGVWPYTAPTR